MNSRDNPGTNKALAALEYAHQAERLSFKLSHDTPNGPGRHMAVEARFVTALDPVIVTASGGRLPAVSLVEAEKLNRLKSKLEKDQPLTESVFRAKESLAAQDDDDDDDDEDGEGEQEADFSSNEQPGPSATLKSSAPSSRTNPLFPPLPLYGPPGILLYLQCTGFRIISFFLSLAFLGVIVLGAIFTSFPTTAKHIAMRLAGKDPGIGRPFYEEEKRRKLERRAAERAWDSRRRRRGSHEKLSDGNEDDASEKIEFEPTEGGRDPVICDVAYYARRVGLDAEKYKVQTEDGFVIVLWHVFNPKEHTPVPPERRQHRGPDVFATEEKQMSDAQKKEPSGTRRYPVLLLHGLLQSAGAYCAIDDDSLAFFLCKSGYDVWLGDNRCGFAPEHTLLKYSDPRMWAWNIRQMGVMDLPALISRVLLETGFEKLALVSHSQGTTQTFVALAKEQRPDLGRKISVFCALAPAAYAGPLIKKAYFKFMRIISPGVFRLVFGIHAFIPLIATIHNIIPGRIYGALGYRVFSFLFNWSDTRWERDLRDRMFQSAPSYVSAESMRWWLGKDCFAHHKCILATREERILEEDEDKKADEHHHQPHSSLSSSPSTNTTPTKPRTGVTAWYDSQVPPFALWIGGSDDLVDGRKLLRRFARGREPHVSVVHAKIIPEYEHLDVLWAMDSVRQVAQEVRDVIWRTLPDDVQRVCIPPRGLGASAVGFLGSRQ